MSIGSVRRLRGVALVLCLCATLVTLTFSLPAADAGGAAYPRKVVDGMGNTVELRSEPRRIVSVSVTGTEILFSLVDPSRIVGVSRFDTDPLMSNVALQASKVGSVIDFNPENVLALNPDLVVVAPWNNRDVINQLVQAGIAVYSMANITEISQIAPNILALGDAVGASDRAQSVVAEMNHRLDELKQIASRATTRPRVLIYTSWGSTYGQGTTYDELVRMSAAVNVADEMGIKSWGNVSEESIIATAPDFIIFDFDGAPDRKRIEAFAANPKFAGIPAVTGGHLVTAEQKHVTTVSQYVVEGFEELLRLFHPELF